MVTVPDGMARHIDGDGDGMSDRGQLAWGRLPDEAGFRNDYALRSVRTIMAPELAALLDTVPRDGGPDAYMAAVLDGNVLGKATASTRERSAERLSELYALDPSVPVFHGLRCAWDLDPSSRPLIACQCAVSRDPFMRSTASLILDAIEGHEVGKTEFVECLARASEGRLGATTLGALAGGVRSSWTQSGHLGGRVTKRRCRVAAEPASAVYGLFLAHLSGFGGLSLFDSPWCRLLDCTPTGIDELAFEASRRGWLTYRRIGSVVEIEFAPALWGPGGKPR